LLPTHPAKDFQLQSSDKAGHLCALPAADPQPLILIDDLPPLTAVDAGHYRLHRRQVLAQFSRLRRYPVFARFPQTLANPII